MRPVSICALLLLITLLPLHAQNPAATAPPAPQKFGISGTIVNSVTYQPIPRVEVSISPTERPEELQQFVTGGDGRFVFENLTRGKYALAAHGPGFVPQAYHQHGMFSTAIAVGPELISDNLVFPLTPEGSISGTVVDEENEALRDGEAILFGQFDEEGRQAIRVRTRVPIDDQGHYHFPHLPPGNYLVAIAAQPWYAEDTPTLGLGTMGRVDPAVGPTSPDAPAENPSADNPPVENPPAAPSPLDVVYPMTFYPAAIEPENAAPIVLHAGERATADISLRALPGLRLTVHNSNADASTPMTVVLEQRLFSDNPLPVQTRGQQTRPGAITVTGVPSGHFILSLRTFNGKEWTSLNRDLDISSSMDIDATDMGGGTVTVKGTVRLPNGSPPPQGAFIRFFNRDSGETFGAQVNEKGEFEAQQNLTAPTRYEVAVFNVPRLLVQSLSADGATVAGRALTLPRSGEVRLSVNMSEGSGRVNGLVLRGEKPAPEAMVLLVPPDPYRNASLFRRDQSDSDGTFTLRDILPGRYTIVAIENGWDLDWQNPAVLRPYLARGEVVDIAANHTYKISVKLPAPAAAASSSASTTR